MRKETSTLVTICLLVGLIHSSQEYGTKGGHRSFTQSYSSASASAQSSSYSSSGSYSFGDKSVLPIIGPIPIAKSTAIASASAGVGAATAVAGAGANAAIGYQNNLDGSSSSAISGTGGYPGHSNSQGHTGQSGSYDNTNEVTKPCCDNIRPGEGVSIHDQKIPSTGTIASGYYIGSGHATSGSYGGSSINSQLSSSGSIYNKSPASSTETVTLLKEEERDEDTRLKKPPCCKPIPPGPNGSIYDYKVPTNVNKITHSSSGISGYSGISTISGTDAESKHILIPSSSDRGHLSSTFSGYGQSNTKPFISNAGTVLSNANVQISSGSGSYGGVQQPSQGISSATEARKPCCKGPFPGPNGSINDSKPASAVGTAVKQEPTKTPIPLHRPPVNFPGPSGSIYTSKPVKTIDSYPNLNFHPINNPPDQLIHTEKPFGNHPSSGDTSVSPFPVGSSNSVSSSSSSISSNTILKPAEGYRPTIPKVIPSVPAGKPKEVDSNQYVYQGISNSADSYQAQYQGSSGSSCTQGPCIKEPPRTYLEPPQNQVKPVKEIMREILTPVALIPTAPSLYGETVSSLNGYNVDKLPHASGNDASKHVQIQGDAGSRDIHHQKPSYTQIHSDQIAVNGISSSPQKQNNPVYNQGSVASSSTVAGSSSSSYSSTGGGVGVHTTFHRPTQKPIGPSFTIIDDNQRGKDEDKILYISGPYSTHTTEKSKVFNVPVTENTIVESGLHEGPRGSPLIPHHSVHGTKTYGYDDSNRDSAIVFIDGQRGTASGSYTSGRGFSGATGFGFSGSVVKDNTDGKNLYNAQKSDSKSAGTIGNEQTGIYKSTIFIDFNNPGNSGQKAIHSGSEITGSATDNSKLSENSAASSGDYSSSSVLHNGLSCTSNRCVTSSKQHSNAVPSQNKNIAISITPAASGNGGSYSSSGSYGGGALNHGSTYLSKNDNSFDSYGTSQVSIGSAKAGSDISSGITGQDIIIVGTSATDDSKLTGDNTKAYSSFSGYGSSGVQNGLPCNSNGCGTYYRHYSNAVPSTGNKNIAFHITTFPSGVSGSFSSTGSYGSGTRNYGSVSAGKNDGRVGSYGSSQISMGSSKAGSAAGSSSHNAGDNEGTGGFLSSIFLGDGISSNSGSYGAAGSYSHASSYAKASSHASSSSFSSASSGSYSSSHY